jgi:hypothetical protein
MATVIKGIETRYSLELRRLNGHDRETIDSWPVASIQEGRKLARAKRGSSSDPYWGTGEHTFAIYDWERREYVAFPA